MFTVSVVSHAQDQLVAALNHAWDLATKRARAVGATIGNERSAAGVLIREERCAIEQTPHDIADCFHVLDEVLRRESGYDDLCANGWQGEAVTVLYVHPLHLHRMADVQANCEIIAVLNDELLHHVHARLVMDMTDGSRDLAWQGTNSLQCAKVYWA